MADGTGATEDHAGGDDDGARDVGAVGPTAEDGAGARAASAYRARVRGRRVATAVDIGAEVVALVAILGNVSVVDVHVGLMIVATPPAALLGQRGLTLAPPEDG